MSREYHLKRKYGITEADYEALLQKQGGLCGCCGRDASFLRRKAAVDHDHKTGEVRGILCFLCNRYVIGRYRRADVRLLRQAIEYLDREYTGWLVPPKRKKKKRGKKRRRAGRILL